MFKRIYLFAVLLQLYSENTTYSKIITKLNSNELKQVRFGLYEKKYNEGIDLLKLKETFQGDYLPELTLILVYSLDVKITTLQFVYRKSPLEFMKIIHSFLLEIIRKIRDDNPENVKMKFKSIIQFIKNSLSNYVNQLKGKNRFVVALSWLESLARPDGIYRMYLVIDSDWFSQELSFTD